MWTLGDKIVSQQSWQTEEFIDGAARLKGSAKALDVWRMECKIEVPGLGNDSTTSLSYWHDLVH